MNATNTKNAGATIESRKVYRSRFATGPGIAWWLQYRVVDNAGRELAGWGTPLKKCRRIVKAEGRAE